MMAKYSALRISAAGLMLLCLAWPARAQSLADVAKKEEERRKTKPEAGKVYTNKDLHKSDGVQAPDAAKTGDAAKDADAKDKDKDKAKDDQKP